MATLPSRKNETALTRRRYNRIAPVYDLIEWGLEWRFVGWRRALWANIDSGRVLEVGVGTGKNLPYHPPGSSVSAIDLSPGMLARAQSRAVRLSSSVHLELADVQDLPFADASFDAAVATFVFCSVPDPVQGLREVRRILKPGGRLFLLEHVLADSPALAWLMRRLDPIPFHLWGAHIDRETVRNVAAAGFAEIAATNLSSSVVKFITARAPLQQAP